MFLKFKDLKIIYYRSPAFVILQMALHDTKLAYEMKSHARSISKILFQWTDRKMEKDMEPKDVPFIPAGSSNVTRVGRVYRKCRHYFDTRRAPIPI